MAIKWTVEFYQHPNGEIEGVEFLKKLRKGAGPDAVSKVRAKVRMLEVVGLAGGTGLVKKLPGDLWELRIEFKNNPYRVLFYEAGNGVLVLLHFFHKKTDAILESDKSTAERRMADDRTRRAR